MKVREHDINTAISFIQNHPSPPETNPQDTAQRGQKLLTVIVCKTLSPESKRGVKDPTPRT